MLQVIERDHTYQVLFVMPETLMVSRRLTSLNEELQGSMTMS